MDADIQGTAELTRSQHSDEPTYSPPQTSLGEQLSNRFHYNKIIDKPMPAANQSVHNNLVDNAKILGDTHPSYDNYDLVLNSPKNIIGSLPSTRNQIIL